MLLVNLGCGKTYDTRWRNYDFYADSAAVITHDLRKGIPLPDSAADVVYHAHVLEHFSREDGAQFITECARVLKPGGTLRVVVPDLEQIARAYITSIDAVDNYAPNATAEHAWMQIELFDQMVRNKSGGAMGDLWRQQHLPAETFIAQRLGCEFSAYRQAYLQSGAQPPRAPGIKTKLRQLLDIGAAMLAGVAPETLRAARFRDQGEVHRWMYDRHSLMHLLQESGFTDTRVCAPDESSIENWQDYALEIRNGKIMKPDSLAVEGSKKPVIQP